MAFGDVGISHDITFLSMLQLQTLQLQKQQELHKLVGKVLDILNVLLVNFVCDICSVGNLIDVVCDITRQHVEPFQLVYGKIDSVEKIFRMLRTGLEYNTFRVHSQKSLESKTYVMFIASIVRNHMFKQLKQVTLKEKDKKNYTVPAAISELEKVTAVKNSNGVYIRRYGLTAKQKKILAQFEITESYLNKLTKELNKRF